MRLTSGRSLILCLASSLALTGCPSKTNDGDTTSPQVVSTSPADGALAVGVAIPITVVFDEAMDTTHDALLVLASSNSVGRSAWKRPPQINTASSAQFCTDCATLLGWMLDANLTPEEISQEWKQALAQR